jgi:hypothetical protein
MIRERQKGGGNKKEGERETQKWGEEGKGREKGTRERMRERERALCVIYISVLWRYKNE